MIFFEKGNTNKRVKNSKLTKEWLNNLAIKEGYTMRVLTYVFMTDSELLEINKEYLDHNTFTDIITFDNSDVEKEIEGDIFISIERVKENAHIFKTTIETELKRVLAHGLLHLCGYKDKTEKEEKLMRQKEDFYLNIYFKKD